MPLDPGPEGSVHRAGEFGFGDRPLPASPFVPGRTPRPETGLFMEIAGRAPESTDPELWRDNEAWLHGFQLYGAGFFWETHEVWEPVWMGTRPNSAERQMVQGLIQLANGCLKLAMERPKAALRLVREAEERLSEARTGGRERLMGVDLTYTQAEVTDFLAGAHAWNERQPLRVLEERPRLRVAGEEL